MMIGSLNNIQVSKTVGWPRQQSVGTYYKLVQRLNALTYHEHWCKYLPWCLPEKLQSLLPRVTRQTVVTCNRDFFGGWRGETHYLRWKHTDMYTLILLCTALDNAVESKGPKQSESLKPGVCSQLWTDTSSEKVHSAVRSYPKMVDSLSRVLALGLCLMDFT